MRDEPFALSTRPPASSAETDYDAICAAVTTTARGRWFLDEFAKRNRNSDTLQVLDAIARMEAAVVGDRTQQAARQAHQEVRVELLEMARTIALTRAEMAESQSEAAQAAMAEPANTAAATGIAGAAERLRQIAWTMRACGVELAASDQIGQIADAILAANAFRDLDDQRTHKLTEALHYLEHRIDRMLDSRLAAAAEAERVAQAPQISGQDREAGSEPKAVAAIGAAIFAAAAAVEAETETEPAVAPANDDTPPAAILAEAAPAPIPEEAASDPEAEQAAPALVLEEAARAPVPEETASAPLPEETAQAPALEEAVSVPVSEEAAGTSVPEQAAPITVSRANEYPMDDDVVLTVADVVIDVEPTLPAIDLGPAFFAASARESTPLPAMDMAPTSFAEAAPTPIVASVDPEPSPISPSKADVQAFQVNRVELEVAPPHIAPANLAAGEVDEPEPPIAAMAAPLEAAAPAAEDETEIAFAGLDLEPLMAVLAIADEAQPDTQAKAHSAAEQAPDEPLLIAAPIFNDVVDLEPVEAPPANSASPEPEPEADFGADDDLPPVVAPNATATDWPDLPEPVAAIELITRADAIAEHHDAPRPAAITIDAIAMQVDNDLDGLTDFVLDDIVPNASQRAAAAPPRNPIPVNAVSEDGDPADFLLEALPMNAPPSAALPERAPLQTAAATTQLSSALFTDALAAIETELRSGIPPGMGAHASAPAAKPPAAAVTPPPITDGALVALMAMSEEERIALFS